MSDRDKNQGVIDYHIALNQQRDAEALTETVRIHAQGSGNQMDAESAIDEIKNLDGDEK